MPFNQPYCSLFLGYVSTNDHDVALRAQDVYGSALQCVEESGSVSSTKTSFLPCSIMQALSARKTPNVCIRTFGLSSLSFVRLLHQSQKRLFVLNVESFTSHGHHFYLRTSNFLRIDFRMQTPEDRIDQLYGLHLIACK